MQGASRPSAQRMARIAMRGASCSRSRVRSARPRVEQAHVARMRDSANNCPRSGARSRRAQLHRQIGVRASWGEPREPKFRVARCRSSGSARAAGLPSRNCSSGYSAKTAFPRRRWSHTIMPRVSSREVAGRAPGPRRPGARAAVSHSAVQAPADRKRPAGHRSHRPAPADTPRANRPRTSHRGR